MPVPWILWVHPRSSTLRVSEKWWLEDVRLSNWVSETFQGLFLLNFQGVINPIYTLYSGYTPYTLGGGFKYFFIFTPIWGRFPI